MVTHVLGITCRSLFKKKKNRQEKKKGKKYVACCITALMYPICGATLNFRWNLFFSFVLDDTVPERFLSPARWQPSRGFKRACARAWPPFHLGGQVSAGAVPRPPRATGPGRRRRGQPGSAAAAATAAPHFPPLLFFFFAN